MFQTNTVNAYRDDGGAQSDRQNGCEYDLFALNLLICPRLAFNCFRSLIVIELFMMKAGMLRQFTKSFEEK